MSNDRRKPLVELTYLARQWQPSDEPLLFSIWMASSEVDQKFLGHFAKTCSNDNPYLSSFLYKVLGLSVLLAKKLLRVRQKGRNDPVRDAQLLYHILWLSREGLVMVEQYILPMVDIPTVDDYVPLKVLSYKLRASFYHIFVLFHNNPPVSRTSIQHKSTPSYSLFPDPLSPRSNKQSSTSSSRQRTPTTSPGRIASTAPTTPPGLPLPIPKPPTLNATFILPSTNYIPVATSCFEFANNLAETLLSGSHPIRLSVKLEYVAYLYDSVGQAEQSRRLAKKSIADVYADTTGMDDDSFEDAAEMVGTLGKMMRRGLSGSKKDSRNGGGGGGNGGGSGGGSGKSGIPKKVQNGTSSRERSTSDVQASRSRSRGHGQGRPNMPVSTWV